MTPASQPVPATPPPAGGTRSADLARIRRFLDRVRRQARRWIWIEALALSCLAAASWFWTTLCLDWLVEPPSGVRIMAAAGLFFWLGGIIAIRLVGRLRTHLRDEPLALLVERTHPDLADSLSTAIELDARADDPDQPLDHALLARTTAAAASALSQVRLSRLFKRTRLLRLAGGAGFAVGMVIAVLVLVPVIREHWWRRLVLFDEAPWPRRVTLTVADFPDGIRRVARGSDVEVVVTATAAGGPPAVVELRSRSSGGWATARMGTRGGRSEMQQEYIHTLRGITDDTTLDIRGGDARLRDLTILAIEPPTLAGLELLMTPPDYIGGGPRPLPASRLVEVPQGATLSVTATASKPLSAAILSDLTTTDTDPAAQPTPHVITRLTAATPADDDPTDSRTSLRQIAGPVGPVLADTVIDVAFTDTAGIKNQQPIRLQLLARADEPPRLSLALADTSAVVTQQAVIPLIGTIEDDHALGQTTIRSRRLPADGAEPTVAEQSLPLAAAASMVTLSRDRPATVRVAAVEAAVGDRLEIVVSAEDRCGLVSGPQTSLTDPWTLEVVPPEKLQAMLEAREIILRRRFESLLADFQQSRDRFAAPDGRSAQSAEADQSRARLADAVARAAGETGEIATGFRSIARELANNALLTAELEGRLLAQIADPLEGIVAGPLTRLADAFRPAPPDHPEQPSPARLLPLTDECLRRLRSVLDKMIELETFNEVVDSLRTLIDQQEAIRGETEQQRKQRAREALRGL